MTTTPEILPDLDTSDIVRVLIVVAHPDDAEYGLSCAVDQWTRAGVEVAYLLLTHGEAGIRSLDPAECGPLRAEEQRRACEAVGVSDLTLLDHPDGQMVYGLDLRRDIARRIREFRPDTVITANFELEAYGTFNQADHRAVGLATVDAVRDADNPWIFSDPDLEAWKVTRLLIVNAGEPTHRMLIDAAAVQAGIASLSSHVRYLEELPNHPKPDVFIPKMLEQPDGQPAVQFRVFDPV